MTQEWTIIKIVGKAAVEIERRLETWSSLRKETDPTAWSADEWPAGAQSAGKRLVAKLCEHRYASPVVYFSRHVDMWSSFGVVFRFFPKGPPSVAFGDSDVRMYRLPDGGRLVRAARRAQMKPQFDETAWLARALEEAALAYKPLWSEALILIHRCPLAGSPSDQDLLKAASRRQSWLGRPAAP